MCRTEVSKAKQLLEARLLRKYTACCNNEPIVMEMAKGRPRRSRSGRRSGPPTPMELIRSIFSSFKGKWKLMLNSIRRFVRRVKTASTWVKALDKAAQGNQAEAMSCMRSIYAMNHAEMPSTAIPYYVNILCGSVASRLEDFDLSVAATMVALRQLKGDIKGLSNFDKDYRLLQVDAAILCFRGKPVVMSRDLLPEDLEYTVLRPQMVKSHIRSNFPVLPPSEETLH